MPVTRIAAGLRANVRVTSAFLYVNDKNASIEIPCLLAAC